MSTISVLKPFRFSEKGKPERIFSVGEHEISDAMAQNPWIARDFADGHIETPAAALKRTQAADEAADRAKADAQRQKKAAEAAAARLGGAARASGVVDEMNAPIGTFVPSSAPGVNAKIGEGIDPNDPALNTPMNELAAKNAAEAVAKAEAEAKAQAKVDEEAAAKVASDAEILKRAQEEQAAAAGKSTLSLKGTK